jgi:ATP-dependent DNA ligase
MSVFIRSAQRTYRGGRCNHWIKVKNPNSPAMKRAAEVDWSRR